MQPEIRETPGLHDLRGLQISDDLKPALKARLFALLIALHFIFDRNLEAFNKQVTITAWLGEYLFFGKWIPAFFNSEFLLFGCLLWFLCFGTEHEKRNIDWRVYQILIFLVGLFPAVALLSGVYGILSGGDSSILQIQIRTIVSLPWMFTLGYICLPNLLSLYTVMKYCAIANALKGLQGIYVYIVMQGASMGDFEYLIEHATSEYFMNSFFFLGLLVFLVQRSFGKRLLLYVLVFSMLPAYIWNDRRAALVGAGFGVICMVLALPLAVIKSHLTKTILLGLGGLATFGLSAVLPPPFNKLYQIYESSTYQGRDAMGFLDYRIVENFNLFDAIARGSPLGLGYGNKVPFVYLQYDFGFYSYYNSLFHNSFLATWALSGVFGIAALGTLVAGLFWYFAKLFAKTSDPMASVFALLGLALIGRWGVWMIADLGLQDLRTTLTLCLLIGGLARTKFEISA